MLICYALIAVVIAVVARTLRHLVTSGMSVTEAVGAAARADPFLGQDRGGRPRRPLSVTVPMKCRETSTPGDLNAERPRWHGRR
ncbi:hypothetical protein [Nonomuraea sp. NPDC003201]